MLSLATGVLALLACTQTSGPSADTRKTPELVREFFSPSGEFRLVISGSKGWLNPRPSAELFQMLDSGRSSVQEWRIEELPHRLGPESAIISNDGIVVLVDEWIRTPSPRALTVFDREGMVKSVYSFDEIAKITGMSPSLMIKSAKTGTWESGKPILAADSVSTRFFTCDTYFSLNLKTGEISSKTTSD